MGAEGRMPLGGADLLDRAVAQREVHLSRGTAGGVGRKASPREQTLRDSVMALVLLEDRGPASREATFPAEARNEAELLERSEMGEGGRGSYMEPESDLLQTGAVRFTLSDRNHSKRLDLPMRELLEGLHVRNEESSLYMGNPNY
jgi:hypothetical protein